MSSHEAAFQQAAALHQAGRLQEAEKLYRSILQAQPDHPEANHNLGMVAIQSKRPAAALPLLETAIKADPDQGRFRLSYVYGLLQAGQVDAARQAFAQSLHLDLDRQAVAALSGVLANHVDDGAALSRQDALLAPLFSEGRFAEAAVVIEEMIARYPLYVEAHFNHCIALKQLHRLPEAEASCRRALALKPDFAEAHGILGSVLHALGRRDAAAASFRRAIELEADPAEAHDNVASLLIAEGDLPAALNFVLQSLRIRETERARRIFVFCVRRLTFAKDDDGVRAMLLRALTGLWARPRALAPVAINFVKLNPVVQACMAPQAPFGAEKAAALAANPLLRALLNAAPVCDVDLERFLTLARRALLESATAGNAPREAGPALDFYSALANQCFINEYVFAHAGDENRKAGELRDALQAALEAGTPVPPLLVLAVAAYFPLASVPLASKLLEAQWPDAISSVLQQQIREPQEESQLRAGIARLTAIDDEISRRVQSQYEENPYPRWIRPAPAGKAMDFATFLRQRFPQASFSRGGARENAERDGTDILIAGCGTGQHPIETGRKFAGARVLAIDLSLSSLGYAKRKTGELGLSNIEYAQADLLQLGSLERRFDLVESVGVLHHLDDPWAGWRVLLSLLRPGGAMRLGFYSELARRHIVRARAFIAERGYGSTADEIRRCRQDLLGPDTGPELRSVTTWTDFFSTSACRDLLFHVQEHRLDLTRIAAFIRANGLEFLGFDIGEEVRQAYRQRFPRDPAGIDLDQWQLFENDNPDTFVGMYQFWVQKASGVP